MGGADNAVVLPSFPVKILPFALPALDLGPSIGKGLLLTILFLFEPAEETQRRQEIPSHDQLPI
jgi:hypothetical protein